MPERLKRELRLTDQQVAIFGSWYRIDAAVNSSRHNVFANVGFDFMSDGTRDPIFDETNRKQTQDLPPWSDARWDRYTFTHAMHFLEKHRPRFMFISLNDSDAWAHKGNYYQYASSLKNYDNWLRDFFIKLDSMGSYGANTTVIVTTDHGRGDGHKWTSHKTSIAGSKNIWLYARSEKTRASIVPSRNTYGHSDIRPTIEALFGLTPVQCKSCGQVIRELL